MTLAEQIRHHRKALGWTQEELARALHRKRPTIAGYERGTVTPPLAVVRQLARLFQCSVRSLVVEEEEEHPCPTVPTAPSPSPRP